MVIFFWSATALLLLLALVFFLPWMRSWRLSLFLIFVISLTSYGLYVHWGSSQYLAHYYSKDEQLYRVKQQDFQLLLAEFQKQEFRLRLRLEHDPNDRDAEWRLLDLLAIKALQDGDRKLAVQYWQSALGKVPEDLKLEFKQKIQQHQDLTP